MQALKVQVKNGRVMVDEPTDLPDGAEVEVVVTRRRVAAWMPANTSNSIGRGVKVVLLAEAQRRFRAEDEWWRDNRDAKDYASTNSPRRSNA